mmetsp:Transcript_8176/g.24660  ORF Transcript_8176/g.24660 Transcript_8176/m.24660 type:complete len:281 (-) Transcript_8176:796-1638(-)
MAFVTTGTSKCAAGAAHPAAGRAWEDTTSQDKRSGGTALARRQDRSHNATALCVVEAAQLLLAPQEARARAGGLEQLKADRRTRHLDQKGRRPEAQPLEVCLRTLPRVRPIGFRRAWNWAWAHALQHLAHTRIGASNGAQPRDECVNASTHFHAQQRQRRRHIVSFELIRKRLRLCNPVPIQVGRRPQPHAPPTNDLNVVTPVWERAALCNLDLGEHRLELPVASHLCHAEAPVALHRASNHEAVARLKDVERHALKRKHRVHHKHRHRHHAIDGSSVLA